MFDLGRNLNLTSADMDDLRRQGIAVDDDNEPSPENVPYVFPNPEYGYSWRYEGIISPR